MNISLSSAVSGLRSHQTKMDVIGNNIANVGTSGFKSSNVSYSDLYYQTLNSRGNPNQVGYGASVSGININAAPSGMTATGRAMDIYISGDGFIITQNSGGEISYTRSGVLSFDAAGNLVDSNGYFVLGWSGYGDTPYPGSPGIITLPSSITLDNGRVIDNLQNKITNISIGKNGEITGLAEGVQIYLGDIAVARFSNPSGLIQNGSNYFTESQSSGGAMISRPGDNGTGTFAAGNLEMPNVDIANEFTDMIMAQRGFEANIRTIATSDEMLGELNNLKR